MLLSGCSKNLNVSDQMTCWGELSPDRYYSIVTDLFVVKAEGAGPIDVPAVTPPGQISQVAGLYSAPFTIEEYAQGDNFGYVKGVVGEGARVTIKELWLTKGWNPFVGAYKNLSIYGSFDTVSGTFDLTDLVIRKIDSSSRCEVRVLIDTRLMDADNY